MSALLFVTGHHVDLINYVLKVLVAKDHVRTYARTAQLAYVVGTSLSLIRRVNCTDANQG